MTAAATHQEERIARAILTYVAEPGDRFVGALVHSEGGIGALKMIMSGSLGAVTCVVETPDRKRVLERLQSRLEKLPPRDEILRTLHDDSRFRLVCPGDAEWPGGLNELTDSAPVALWVAGVSDLAFSCRRSVVVTGSRAATAYGSYLAAEISASLSTQGMTVVAGGSFGIDAAAHRGALATDGATIVVTAGGIDVPYPAAHADLFNAIAAQGVLLSEAPPGTLPGRLRFQARNRLIPALATGTVIVEAAFRSGAMAVAGHARDLGRPVMAIPGPVTSDLSAGCHDLIRSGHAVLVTSANDVIDTLAGTARPAG